MPILDITTPSDFHVWSSKPGYTLSERLVPLKSDATQYTGVCYTWTQEGMCGSYIDFPGHIRETDDGADASNYPVEKLYRQNARVIHLNRQSDSGEISADELRRAAGGDLKTDVLILNALGEKQSWEINQRSVWLGLDAVDWAVSTGCHIFISDVYESTRLEGVFLKFFQNGVATVCEPKDLARLPGRARISVFFQKVPAMKQVPCRLIAEF